MSAPNPAFPAPGATMASALRTLELERAGLAAIETVLKLEPAGGLAAALESAVSRIAAGQGRVIVSGMGKSGLIGRKIAATLASTGTPAYFVHPGEASHGDLGMIHPSDMLLLLSWSGETAELADIITFSRRFSILLIAITSNADSALGREADICLQLPSAEEACPNGLAPTTSTTMQLAIGDVLAIALLEAKGFTAHEFRQFHPGGKLGARLSFVRDIMHKGSEIPLVQAGSAMRDAIIEMSGKRFGCVGIVDSQGRLSGIITDGDLRRRMEKSGNFLDEPVDAVMTTKPIVISPDLMAAEALALLNDKRRSVLLVVDDAQRPVGVVHLHDLLHLGAA